MERLSNLFTVLKKLKECVGFFFFNNLIATNGWGFTQLCVGSMGGKIALKPVLGVWFYLKFFFERGVLDF